jgi:hypothetical protein
MNVNVAVVDVVEFGGVEVNTTVGTRTCCQRAGPGLPAAAPVTTSAPSRDVAMSALNVLRGAAKNRSPRRRWLAPMPR